MDTIIPPSQLPDFCPLCKGFRVCSCLTPLGTPFASPNGGGKWTWLSPTMTARGTCPGALRRSWLAPRSRLEAFSSDFDRAHFLQGSSHFTSNTARFWKKPGSGKNRAPPRSPERDTYVSFAHGPTVTRFGCNFKAGHSLAGFFQGCLKEKTRVKGLGARNYRKAFASLPAFSRMDIDTCFFPQGERTQLFSGTLNSLSV